MKMMWYNKLYIRLSVKIRFFTLNLNDIEFVKYVIKNNNNLDMSTTIQMRFYQPFAIFMATIDTYSNVSHNLDIVWPWIKTNQN